MQKSFPFLQFDWQLILRSRAENQRKRETGEWTLRICEFFLMKNGFNNRECNEPEEEISYHFNHPSKMGLRAGAEPERPQLAISLPLLFEVWLEPSKSNTEKIYELKMIIELQFFKLQIESGRSYLKWFLKTSRNG